MPGLDVRLAEAEDPVVLSPGLIIETLQEEDSSNPDTQVFCVPKYTGINCTLIHRYSIYVYLNTQV